MKDALILKNRLKEAGTEKSCHSPLWRSWLACHETPSVPLKPGSLTPPAKLALILCIALDKKFEELFYF